MFSTARLFPDVLLVKQLYIGYFVSKSGRPDRRLELQQQAFGFVYFKLGYCHAYIAFASEFLFQLLFVMLLRAMYHVEIGCWWLTLEIRVFWGLPCIRRRWEDVIGLSHSDPRFDIIRGRVWLYFLATHCVEFIQLCCKLNMLAP